MFMRMKEVSFYDFSPGFVRRFNLEPTGSFDVDSVVDFEAEIRK